MVSQGRTTHSILFVSNISSKTTTNSLSKWFTQFGKVKEIQIIEDESVATVEFTA